MLSFLQILNIKNKQHSLINSIYTVSVHVIFVMKSNISNCRQPHTMAFGFVLKFLAEVFALRNWPSDRNVRVDDCVHTPAITNMYFHNSVS